MYADGTQFEATIAIQIALGIVSAARHLHAHGITHGDLYAHNILVNPDGLSLLGDFGAASFFSPDDRSLAQALQAIEVRAVGCLFEELLARSEADEGSRLALNALAELTATCLQDDVLLRPRLAEIERMLGFYQAGHNSFARHPVQG